MYPTQYTSSMGTARVKQEADTDKNNSKRVVKNIKERNVGTIMGKSPKQGQTRAKDLSIELPEGRQLPYHRID